MKYLIALLFSINTAYAGSTMVCVFNPEGQVNSNQRMLVTVDDRKEQVITSYDGIVSKSALLTSNKYYMWEASDNKVTMTYSINRYDLFFILILWTIADGLKVTYAGQCHI